MHFEMYFFAFQIHFKVHFNEQTTVHVFFHGIPQAWAMGKNNKFFANYYHYDYQWFMAPLDF